MRGIFLALVGLTACSGSPPDVLDPILPLDAAPDVVTAEAAEQDAAFDAGREASTDAGSDAHDSAPDSRPPPPPLDAGTPLGWAAPCDSCVYANPHDCAGIGPPGSGPYTSFTCAMACDNPPPTLTSGPSNCYYIGKIGPTSFEMCCPSTNPGF